MAIKLEDGGGGGRGLMDEPLVEELFLRLSLLAIIARCLLRGAPVGRLVLHIIVVIPILLKGLLYSMAYIDSIFGYSICGNSSFLRAQHLFFKQRNSFNYSLYVSVRRSARR